MYRGISFRGLNEARCARALTLIGLEWVYELERVPLGPSPEPKAKTYTSPDFWLADDGLKCWVEFTESRGPSASDEWVVKKQDTCQRLAVASARPVVFVWSFPVPHGGRSTLAERSEVYWPCGSKTVGRAVTIEEATRWGSPRLHGMLTCQKPAIVSAFRLAYNTNFSALDPQSGEVRSAVRAAHLQSEAQLAEVIQENPIGATIHVMRASALTAGFVSKADWAEAVGCTPEEVSAAFAWLKGMRLIADHELPAY